jgi:hypothetical protein
VVGGATFVRGLSRSSHVLRVRARSFGFIDIPVDLTAIYERFAREVRPRL